MNALNRSDLVLMVTEIQRVKVGQKGLILLISTFNSSDLYAFFFGGGGIPKKFQSE
jgi:hypothetical protein